MKKGRRAFAIFMAMIMVIALLPTAAFAQDDGEANSDETLGAEVVTESVGTSETDTLVDASEDTDTDVTDTDTEDVGDATVEETEDVDDAIVDDTETDDADDEFAVEPEEGDEDEAVEVEEVLNAGIMLLSAGQRALEQITVSVVFENKMTAKTISRETIYVDSSTEKITAETLAAKGIDLTGDGKYTMMSCSMTSKDGNGKPNIETGHEFIEVETLNVKSIEYIIYVIVASQYSGAKINFDIQFKDEKGNDIVPRPEGYAIEYTAKLGADWEFLPESTCEISGEVTLEEHVYIANCDYQNRITVGEPKNTDMTGYKFDRMEIGEFSTQENNGVYAAYDNSGNRLENTYETTQGASEMSGSVATLTITNYYTKVDTYTVTWKDFDGKKFHTEPLNEGTDIPEEYLAACPGGEPYHETITFGGWNKPEADGKNFVITPIPINPHSVEVESKNGKFVTQTVKHGGFATEPSYEITKNGYTFGGWKMNGEPFDFSTPITKDGLKIEVNWIPEKRTVTWMDGDDKIAETEVDYGTAVTAPELTAREGYRLGWTLGESDFNLETPITADIILNAKWVKQVTHTWISEGETLGTETADEGASVTAPANPTRAGYTFNGWSTSTDAWGNVTYTAQWRANSSGGGTGGGGSIGGGDNTGDNTGGDNTGGNGGETIGGGEGGEGNDPADENDPNGENGENENGGLVDIDDEGTALGDRPFTFIDVTKNDWFYDAVYAVWEKELMTGTSATTFEPSAMTTRGMLVTILYRMEGSPEVVSPNSFDDVAEDMYYAKAVTWAAANEIVTGYDDNTFGPEDVLLREQTAAILYRYAKYKGMDVATDGALEFDDADKVSDYAADAMLWAVSVGLINGVDESTLAPQDGTERSHMATLLTRLVAMTETKDDTTVGTTDGENVEGEQTEGEAR